MLKIKKISNFGTEERLMTFNLVFLVLVIAVISVISVNKHDFLTMSGKIMEEDSGLSGDAYNCSSPSSASGTSAHAQ